MRLSFAVMLLGLAVAGPAVAREYTAAIEHAGIRYGSSEFELRTEGALRSTRERFHIDISANGSRETLSGEKRSAESADGKPVSQSQHSGVGTERREAEAHFSATQIQLQRRFGAQQLRSTLPLPADLLVDAGLVRRIAAQPGDRPWSLEYTELDLFEARLVQVRLSSDGMPVDGVLELRRESVADGRGSSRRLRWSIAQQRLLPEWKLVDATFTSRACADDCAAQNLQYFDLLGRLSVATPYRFPALARRKTLRYVFESTDGVAPVFPHTGEQTVVQRGARSVVTICADCGDEAAPSAAELSRYRRANAWVQSDDREIITKARSIGTHGTIAGRMRRLEQAVYLHMNGSRETLGYASALQALRSRSGDCTEFALLLAALARASGLPARVVGGIAYSSHFTGKRDVFSPHAWVQVWDGTRWRSFDAGLGDFESTHVALAVGDGSAEDYAGLLERIRQLRLVDAGMVRP